MTEKKVVKIRGHHLLCLQGFQGYGYSPDFVDGLWQLVSDYQKNPDLYFQTTLDTDAICAPCPHRDGLICRKDADAETRMKKIDRIALEKLNLPVGHISLARELLNYVNTTLKTRESVAEICGTCPWQESCRWYEGRS